MEPAHLDLPDARLHPARSRRSGRPRATSACRGRGTGIRRRPPRPRRSRRTTTTKPKKKPKPTTTTAKKGCERHDHDPAWRTMTRPDLAALLRVQERDTGLDRLRYRRSTIPEREAISERRALEAQLVARVRRDPRRARHDPRRRTERLDDEAQALARKAKEVDGKLYSGTVSSPRELLDMQADIDQLDRHRSTIEEQELEVMERRESLDGELAALEAELSGVRAELAALEASAGDERGRARRRDRGRGGCPCRRGRGRRPRPARRLRAPPRRRTTAPASRCSSGARARAAGCRSPRPRSIGCAKTPKPASRRATTAAPSSCPPVERDRLNDRVASGTRPVRCSRSGTSSRARDSTSARSRSVRCFRSSSTCRSGTRPTGTRSLAPVARARAGDGGHERSWVAGCCAAG